MTARFFRTAGARVHPGVAVRSYRSDDSEFFRRAGAATAVTHQSAAWSSLYVAPAALVGAVVSLSWLKRRNNARRAAAVDAAEAARQIDQNRELEREAVLLDQADHAHWADRALEPKHPRDLFFGAGSGPNEYREKREAEALPAAAPRTMLWRVPEEPRATRDIRVERLELERDVQLREAELQLLRELRRERELTEKKFPL
jgi:hypothetical protein